MIIKPHVGVDKDTDSVHHVEVTSANIHDVTVLPQLLTRSRGAIYGDNGYLGVKKRKDAVKRNEQR